MNGFRAVARVEMVGGIGREDHFHAITRQAGNETAITLRNTSEAGKSACPTALVDSPTIVLLLAYYS